MPRITAKTNVFLNREKKYRMTLEFKEAIELIPCEKGSFVMADFEDEAFMLFGDEAASDPCAAIEVAVIQDAFDKYDKEIFVQVLARMTETVMKYTQIPEDRIFAYYRNSPLWTYKRQDIIGTLVHI